MPRLGFAYKLNEKTVVRGGYGIFFGFLGQRRGDVNQIGFATNTAMNVTTNNGVTFNETLSNPVPGRIERAARRRRWHPDLPGTERHVLQPQTALAVQPAL